MANAQNRILVDQSLFLVDGKPFFTFGPRVLLTPQERYRPTLMEIAAAGFTTVGSPPCSPGNLPQLDVFFDAAEEAGLLVVLIADPRLPEHGRYIAERFQYRQALHSYLLPSRPSDEESLRLAVRERDAIRTVDLFHPIWIPLRPDQFTESWLRLQDLYGAATEGTSKEHRQLLPPELGRSLSPLSSVAASVGMKPILAPEIPVFVPDRDRELGLYADDPWVSRLSPKAIDWYPFLANFQRIPRRDILAPDPELLRLQFYALITSGSRGGLLHFAEGMGGPLPYSGRDRFCEASILAREMATIYDFTAAGEVKDLRIDTGHPRLACTAINHQQENLLILRIQGYEDEFFIDEAYLDRVEIEVPRNVLQDCQFWRIDYPATTQLEVHREASGTTRVIVGSVELTGLIIATPRAESAVEIANQMREHLPHVARFCLEEAQIRMAKIQLIEGELRLLGSGIDNMDRLRAIQAQIADATSSFNLSNFSETYVRSRRALRQLRTIVKYQMAKALAIPLITKDVQRNRLRMNYFTLPRFYREGALEMSKAFTELT